MNIKSAFSDLCRWIRSTELFARPEKEIPGKWHLSEFFTEPAGELIHLDKQQLKDAKLFWDIEICKNGDLLQRSNLPVLILEGSEALRWQRSQLFLKVFTPFNPDNHDKLQYAVDGGLLKLLKKRGGGEIEIFAFFQRDQDDM